jgi:hypothetical protein
MRKFDAVQNRGVIVGPKRQDKAGQARSGVDKQLEDVEEDGRVIDSMQALEHGFRFAIPFRHCMDDPHHARRIQTRLVVRPSEQEYTRKSAECQFAVRGF